MAPQSSKKKRKKTHELKKILSRVDKLPVLDNRSPEEIIGYDESGVPSCDPSPKPAAPPGGEPDSWEPFDFAAHKKRILADPASRAVIEDFLKNRHREWELDPETDPPSRSKRGRARAPRKARRSDSQKINRPCI